MGSGAEVLNIYSLSPMQEAMLYQSLVREGTDVNLRQIIFDINGEIDIICFESCLNLLIERHDIFRTVFVYRNIKKPRQVVLKKRKINLNYVELSGGVPDDIIESDRQKGFDLSKDVLLRLTLVRVGSDRYKAIFSFHHIILDGWCMGAVIDEFFRLYKAHRNGSEPVLHSTYPYCNYIEWIEARNKQQSLDYWSSYLKAYEHKQILPDFEDKSIIDSAYKQALFNFDSSLTEKLIQIARDNRVTLNVVFVCLWGILLNKYTGIDDILVGTVISDRSPEIDGFEEMVGLFLNTVPTRITLRGKKNFTELLAEVQDSVISAQEHGYVSLTEVLETARLRNDSIDHIVVFENHLTADDMGSLSTDGELGFELDNIEYFEPISYNLGVFVYPARALEIKINYNAKKFSDYFIAGIKRHLVRIAEAVSANPLKGFYGISIMDYREERLLLETLNNTESAYDKEKPVHVQFEEQVKRAPDEIAVIFSEQAYTYSELNHSANRIAHLLRSKGVKGETIVGIAARRSFEMLAGIIGILKAGGAYLPVDFDYPAERIKYLLKDSEAKILLITQELPDELEFSGDIINLTDKSSYNGNNYNPECLNKPDSLAYITYTSGSTGSPKGVMVEHRAICNFIKGITDIIDFRQGKCILALTTISFDIFVLEMLLPLTKGLHIAIADEEQQKNPRLLAGLIEKSKVDMLQATPSRIQLLLNYDSELSCLKQLKEIMVGGESLPVHVFNKLKQLKDLKIYNMYGPTETTVWSTVGELTASNFINIGKPIANTQVYIVDSSMRLQPAGIAGELCIAGDGLSRGYYNRKELTDAKFVENPFRRDCRMYRTGDLARWVFDSNGNASIQFIGRLDNQMKIRGYRIEAGEIESRIIEYPGVVEAVVVQKQEQSGGNYLCAYITADSKPDTMALRRFLNKGLPYYMIPAYFVELEELPHTPNGKVDYKKLLQMADMADVHKKYEAPADELEEQLVKIWQEILGVSDIGVQDSFFELGGHSIKAAMLSTYIYKTFGTEIKLGKVMNELTIRGLKELIVNSRSQKYCNIIPIGEKTHYPLSAAQNRIFAVSQLDKSDTSYNMPFAVLLKGEADKNIMNSAFGEIISRYEILRTSFELIDGKALQRVNENINFNIEYKNSNRLNLDNEMADFLRPFRLDEPPLIRVRLVKLRERLNLLLLDMHHIISDETSISILLDEFQSLLEGNKLQPVNIHYKDYIAWQNKLFESEEYRRQEAYWLGVFDGQLPRLRLPLDFERPRLQSHQGKSLYFSIPGQLFDKLSELALKTKCTMYMILLACLNILLHKYTAQEDIVIGSSISSRVHPDLENMVGMLINTMALRNYPKGEKTLAGFLQEIRESCLQAYENRDYQFDELVKKLKLIRDPARNILFDVFFDLHNNEFRRDKKGSLSTKIINLESKISKFDISLEASQSKNRIFFIIEYCTELFTEKTIFKFKEDYIKILNSVTEPEFVKIEDIKVHNSLVTIDNPISEGVEFKF